MEKEKRIIRESPVPLFKIFNWLLKRVPYTLAVVVPNTLWAIFAAIFGFFLVLARADFETTETGGIFLYTLLVSVLLSALFVFIEFGLLRFFGIKRWEKKEARLINDNVLEGRIRFGLSNQKLSELYTALEKTHKWFLDRNIQYTISVVIICALVEIFSSGQLRNVPIILSGGFIAVTISFICTIPLYELLFSPVRRECKILLDERGITFKESYLFSLKIKSMFFIVLTFLAVGIFLMLTPCLELIHFGFFIITLFIMGILSTLVFESIYKTFIEIEESAKELKEGKRTSFLSGSLDREVIKLSKNLNLAATEIYEFQKALETRVKARTKQLEELSKGLDEKVKQKTEELQTRINQLERFRKITVGRELKMIELKGEIKKLKKELGIKMTKRKK